ncbi:hypothetical protein [Photobacterium swingsii]|uniref:hypothetical protein n=1 Tax=Photobacterium swingsii TaxID=680026 RepID=UPI0040689694
MAETEWVTSRKVREMGQEFYVFYDRDYCPLAVPTDYYIHIANQQLSPYTQAKVHTDLVRLFSFLQQKKRDWLSMDDKLLKEYRDWYLAQVKAEPQSEARQVQNGRKGNAPKRTTNDALRRTYQFYRWAQEEQRHPRLIGETADGAQIYSRLTTRHNADDNEDLYPLTFIHVGEGTKHRGDRSATEDDYKELVALINRSSTPYIRKRDSLIVQIISETGQRPDAIASLTIHDFAADKITKAESRGENKFSVQPARQKFGYENVFDFDWTLVHSITAYIEGARKDHLTDKPQGCDQGMLLLTSNGTPLKNGGKSITKRFNYLTKKLLWPKGKSIYSLRHKWMNKRHDEEIRIQSEIGGDTSGKGVRAAIAKDAGHASPDSADSYLRARSALGAETLAAQDHQKLIELRTELTASAAREAFLLDRLAHYERLLELYETTLVKHGLPLATKSIQSKS